MDDMGDHGAEDFDAEGSSVEDSGVTDSGASDSGAVEPDPSDSDAPDSDADDPNLCDFCRLPLSKDTVTLERDTVYEFCSESCRDAMVERDHVFTEYHGFRRIETGVAGLDRFLPQGFPRNSFVLLANDTGSRDSALLVELVWRALERGEPAAVVTFTEPPISVVEQFLSLDWNVLPYLEEGQLHIVDCFTYRVSNRERMFERMDEWNRHIQSFTEPVTKTVRDPSDVTELQNKLDNCLESLEMSDCGVVVIDSLTEFGTLVQPVQAYDFVKDIRADICKGRFVPIFAGATFTGDEDQFPHDLGYAVDGIIDMELNGSIVEDTLLKRIRIRKMNGVLAIPEWVSYEFTAGKGLIPFDPIEEMEATYEGEEAEPSDEDGDSAQEDPKPQAEESATSESTTDLQTSSGDAVGGEPSHASPTDDVPDSDGE